jgi:hypothetical protein
MFTDKGSRSEPTSGTLRLLTVINEYLANLAVKVSLLSNLTTMSLLPALAAATLAALRPKQTHDQSVWQYLLGRFANFCYANRRGCEKLHNHSAPIASLFTKDPSSLRVNVTQGHEREVDQVRTQFDQTSLYRGRNAEERCCSYSAC